MSLKTKEIYGNCSQKGDARPEVPVAGAGVPRLRGSGSIPFLTMLLP